MSPFLTTLGGGSARGFGRGKLIVSLGTPPGIPTALQVQSQNTDSNNAASTTLLWQLPATATGAQVEIYVNGVLNTTTSANATTATITGLTGNVQYSYYVVALRSGLRSSASSTTAQYTAPRVISGGITLTPSVPSGGDIPNRVTVSWTNTENLSVQLLVNGVLNTTISAGNTSGVVSGVPSVTQNYISARYVNQDGWVGNPTQTPITVQMYGAQNLASTSTNTSTINFTWTNRDLTSNAYLYTAYTDSYLLLPQQTTVNGSYALTGLSAGQLTGATIRYSKYDPVNEYDQTADSNYMTAVSKPNPPTPTLLALNHVVVSGYSNIISVRWTNSSPYPQTRVYRGYAYNPWTGTAATEPEAYLWYTSTGAQGQTGVDFANNQITDSTGGNAQLTYRIKLQHIMTGYSGTPISDMSSEISALMPSNAQSSTKPLNVSITKLSSTSIRLNWTNSFSPTNSYVYTYGTTTIRATAAGAATQATISGLTPGQTYTYYVRHWGSTFAGSAYHPSAPVSITM